MRKRVVKQRRRVVTVRPAGLSVTLAGVSPVPRGMEAGLAEVMKHAVEGGDVYGLVVAVLHPAVELTYPAPRTRKLHWTISQVLPGRTALATQAMRLLGEGLRVRRV